MRKNNARSVAQSWLEASIVGICIALTAILLQALLGKEDWPVRLLALVGASIVVCLVQFVLSNWRLRHAQVERPREMQDEPNRTTLF